MSLGADYEVFVANADGRPVPASIFGLGGKTGEHRPLYQDGKVVGTVHRDNHMLEMCIPPAQTAGEMALSVGRVMYAAMEFVQAHDDSLYISTNPSATFTDEEVDTPEARDIGCDRDFISNNGESAVREAISAKELGNERFAGGHIHVSYDTGLAPPWVGATLCDFFLGIPNQNRLNRKRAPYYGLSTLHRPTRYPDGTEGVEYRVLDSFWVHGPDIRVLRGAGLVQELLTPEHVDVVRELVGVHMRSIRPGTIMAEFDGKLVRDEVRATMQTLAPRLAEEYHDTI